MGGDDPLSRARLRRDLVSLSLVIRRMSHRNTIVVAKSSRQRRIPWHSWSDPAALSGHGDDDAPVDGPVRAYGRNRALRYPQ